MAACNVRDPIVVPILIKHLTGAADEWGSNIDPTLTFQEFAQILLTRFNSHEFPFLTVYGKFTTVHYL